ncbi:MAG TPA: GNAT family N-acetyltransferase, partial [Micromonosporaceae bacterium]
MAELADVLRGVADGSPPPTDSELTVLAPPDERSVGVLAFPGQNIIVADVSAEWVRSWLTGDDLSEPFSPQFLNLLAAVTGRAIGNVDSVLVARAHGRRRGLELAEITDSDHPRLVRARLHRADVRA